MADEPVQIAGLPDDFEVPGVYAALDFSQAIKGILGTQNKALIFGQRMPAFIAPARWQGGTLPDGSSQGTYTGTIINIYELFIDAADTPDTFMWRVNKGAWTTGVAVTGSAQALDNGVTFTWAATTGHAAGDGYTFEAFPEPSIAKEVLKQTTNSDDGHRLSGYGSMVGRMVSAAYKQNPVVDMSFISLDDNGSNFAAGSLDLTTALEAGTFTFRGTKDRFQVAVAKNDTPEATAIALQNAIAADVRLPFTVAVNNANPSLIDIVAKNAGTIGNLIKLQVDAGDTGIVPVLVQPTGGSTDPSITAALTALASSDQYYWAYPYKDSTTVNELRADINDRSGALKQRPAIMFLIESLDFNDAILLTDVVNTGRGQNYAVEGILKYPPEIIAAAISELTLSATNIKNYQNSVFKDVDVPDEADSFTLTEENLMLKNGVTPLKTKNRVDLLISATRSMYLRDSQGNADTAQKSVNTTRAGDLVRKDVVIFIDSLYGQSKVNAVDSIEKDIIARMLLFEALGILQNVLENQDLIKKNINIVNDQRLDFQVPEEVIADLTIIGLNFAINALGT